MIDTSSLYWGMSLDIDDMKVADLGEMMKCIAEVNQGDHKFPTYDIGTARTDNVKLEYNDSNGTFELNLDNIYDQDMADVLDILTEFEGVRISKIFHEAGCMFFVKNFHIMDKVQMLDVYRDVLKQNKYDLKAVWDYWKQESGFNKFVEEVYENDD